MAGKVSTRELGLILGARLLKTDDLHYGLWGDGLEIQLANLPVAQQRYTDFLLDHIPAGAGSVLDVGCGTGHISQQLKLRGYEVEAISPSQELTRHARARLGDAFKIHPTTFEGFHSAKRFDVVLFSESFQYMRPNDSLPKAHQLLTDGGHVLICDFFRSGAPGQSALRGGHDLAGFYAFLETQPYDVVSDEDITQQTAPNLQLMDELLADVGLPIWEALGYYMRHNRPWLSKLGARLFRKKLAKLHFKYFARERTAEMFALHKSYRCFLLRKR